MIKLRFELTYEDLLDELCEGLESLDYLRKKGLLDRESYDVSLRWISEDRVMVLESSDPPEEPEPEEAPEPEKEPSSGGRLKVTPAIQSYIKRRGFEGAEPWEIAEGIAAVFSVNVSHTTVEKWMKRLDAKPQKHEKKCECEACRRLRDNEYMERMRAEEGEEKTRLEE